MGMTKKEALKGFKEMYRCQTCKEIHIYGHGGEKDRVALREAWNNWTDMLCKASQITLRQYETWQHPKEWR